MLGSAPKAHYSNIEQGTARSTVKELKFGIIGTGWPGQQHAIALAEIPDVQLRSCADTIWSGSEVLPKLTDWKTRSRIIRSCCAIAIWTPP